LGAVSWLPDSDVLGRVVAIRRYGHECSLDTARARVLGRLHAGFLERLNVIGRLDTEARTISLARRFAFTALRAIDLILLQVSPAIICGWKARMSLRLFTHG
jgi:hypothetical protein